MKNGVKDFYLSIENDEGVEVKLNKKKLEMILKGNKDKENGVKLAFVSACQSEKIGEIIHEAGVPIVIAVNSTQEILDEACAIFSSEFYKCLLKGYLISDAWRTGLDAITNSVTAKQFSNACCCAHPHDENCAWYKWSQEEGQSEATHNLHSFKCACTKRAPDKRRIHEKTC